MVKNKNLVIPVDSAPSSSINVAAINSSSQVYNSGFKIDDGSNPSSFVLWSSDKLKNTAKLQVPVQANSLAILDATGQYSDSGIVVDDSKNASSFVIWTSDRVNDKAELSVPAAAGNLAKIDEIGQYQDSGFKIDDSSNPSSFVVWSSQKVDRKADKIQNAVLNNIATLESNGQFVDSGKKINDFLGPSSDVLWSSSKVMAKPQDFVENNFTSFDSSGQLKDSSFKVDDSLISDTTLWSSLKISNILKILCVIEDTDQSPTAGQNVNFSKTLFQYGDLPSNLLLSPGVYQIFGQILFENVCVIGVYFDGVLSTTCNITRYASIPIIGLLTATSNTQVEVKVISGNPLIHYSMLQIKQIV